MINYLLLGLKVLISYLIARVWLDYAREKSRVDINGLKI